MAKSIHHSTKIGVIGYGRFGKLLVSHLSKQFPIEVFDSFIGRTVPKLPHITFSTIETVASQRVIILAVPINQLQSVLTKISTLLQPDSLIIDVCSVKEKPVQWMKTILPQSVSILGTHPMFGPDSARHGLKGKTIALTPIRIPDAQFRKIKKGLLKAGLHTIVTTPAEHDKQVAYTQALTHFVARIWSHISLPETTITTHSFELLTEISQTLSKDSEELFKDMHTYNRFAKKARSTFLKEAARFERLVQ